MVTKRITAIILSLILIALLGWSVLVDVGDLRTRIMLGAGIALGVLYAVFGRIPDWVLNHTGDFITQDDDPSNIPPRVYLPILFGVLLIALITFVVGVFEI